MISTLKGIGLIIAKVVPVVVQSIIAINNLHDCIGDVLDIRSGQIGCRDSAVENHVDVMVDNYLLATHWMSVPRKRTR